MTDNKLVKKCFFVVREYIFVLIMAFIMAVNYEIFILPNNFAPAGINGIATMIQYKFGFNIGYMNFLINIPLCIAAFFMLNKKYAFKTLVFCIGFSVFILYFNKTDFYAEYGFNPINSANSTLAAVAAGVINGFIYGQNINNDASSGGTDIISAMLRKKKPYLSVSWISFILNTAVAIASFFVYEYHYEPVILSVIYAYLTGKVSEKIVRGVKEQLKFEIITDYPEEISKEIIDTLHHSVTNLHAKGMYSESEKYLLICIINKQQIVTLQKILKKYPGTFAYVMNVSETLGNFKKRITLLQ